MVKRDWLRDGASLYTLKEPDGPRRSRGGPRMVNDLYFQVQGPNAEAVAAEILTALTEYHDLTALKARVAELEAREAAPVELTPDELDLLKWLGAEDYSQYGECHGPALDGLVEKGLAQIHPAGEHQPGFIAQDLGGEGGAMYRAVSLTDKGHARRAEAG